MWNKNFRRLADSFIGGKGFAKSIRICLLGLAVCGVSELCADQKVNLTPLPKNIQVREGVFCHCLLVLKLTFIS